MSRQDRLRAKPPKGSSPPRFNGVNVHMSPRDRAGLHGGFPASASFTPLKAEPWTSMDATTSGQHSVTFVIFTSVRAGGGLATRGFGRFAKSQSAREVFLRRFVFAVL